MGTVRKGSALVKQATDDLYRIAVQALRELAKDDKTNPLPQEDQERSTPHTSQ